jgi:hypothetical protein
VGGLRWWAALVVLGCGGTTSIAPRKAIALDLPAAPVDERDPCDDEDSWPPATRCVERLAAAGERTCLVTRMRAFCWDPDGVAIVARDDLDDAGLQLAGFHAEKAPRACRIDARTHEVTCDGDHLSVTFEIDPGASMALPAGAVARRVAVGREHFCVLARDGAVHCQGDNDQGQLGDGSIRTTFNKPVRVAGLPPARDIALGDDHGCALTQAGAVYCWGQVPSPPGHIPPLATLRYVDAVFSAGGTGLCALSEGGVVACRGFATQVFQRKLEDVVEIRVMGQDAIFARDRAGRVWRWYSGREPERVQELEPAQQLVPRAACARVGAEIRCLSPYDYANSRERPAYVVPGMQETFAGPSVGEGDTSCGLDGGVLRCWGTVGLRWYYDNTPPQLQPSLWMPHWDLDEVVVTRPQKIPGARDLVAVNDSGSCALDAQGRVFRIDHILRGTRAQLRLDSHPKAVDAARIISISPSACVAERRDGSVFHLVIGAGAFPTDGPTDTPPVAIVELPEAAGAEDLVVGSIDCLRDADNHTRCRWGRDGARGAFDTPLTQAPARRIVGSENEVCALLEEGGIHCRRVEYKRGLTAVLAPMHRGSTVPIRVWPLPVEAEHDDGEAAR